MKKVLIATLFAFATLGFTACDSSTSTSGETTDTTTVDQETITEETIAPADTAAMSADTTGTK